MTTATRVPADPWPAPTAHEPVRAVVRVPGSKSGTNRALVLAAAADGVSRLRGALRSRDTVLMAGALRALGVGIDQDESAWVVRGGLGRRDGTPTAIDCGNAGTVARFTPALAALTDGDVTFDGDPRMRHRPLTPLLDALRALGAVVDGDLMPLVVRGRGGIAGGAVTVDASDSSQLISGLLLAAPGYDQGVEVSHVGGRLPSGPYLDMTVTDLRAAGATVETEPGDPADQTGRPPTWRVSPGPLRAYDRAIEPDLNSAAPFLAAAVATGGDVTIPDWPTVTTQPGRMLPGLLEAMGAHAELTPEGLRVRGGDGLHGLDADLGDVGEAAPVLTALAVLADSPSRLRGIAHLRLQETDRLGALADQLGRLGADISVTEDGLAIRPAPLRGARLDPLADHRLAMTYAVVGLRVPGITVDDIATTGKTVPEFPAMWAAMLAA
ncbi:3-phosphoshikimate 1-carboxyvinyltransferase [Frankia sp. AgB1.9]|uniref:3-phosphoshikimate 1-carboxyvinyltransferase n=1 Tax=unclassified Frankia TaxID=2632575 RepID=UPI0019327E91|nr:MULTISPECIES: 3-phosphoshikimate 1-carboxyvinyltransferase [unclassified Frankia]MBL7494180.1 3-phosphoshikimate 1-carboxyvinyltransferase [Frankia sp. AgW1.1]MBL7552350.1 3-phosphoshikimate 1-carboxyvinyltransferase [Frankia sp. AgB1.9]MBL7625487.1 3-phosphoshikimate 1-carboxyvinyltransferase [Frankia sp. AgB1.8]